MKKAKETEQYSNAKIRMVLKTSPKIIAGKKCCSKFIQSKASKSSVPNYVKNQLQKLQKKIQRKKTNY